MIPLVTNKLVIRYRWFKDIIERLKLAWWAFNGNSILYMMRINPSECGSRVELRFQGTIRTSFCVFKDVDFIEVVYK